MSVLAVVRDLFFVARIRETARLVGSPIAFPKGPDDLAARLQQDSPRLVIVDLTMSDWDYDALFRAIEARPESISILGFTTHVLARQTQPLHGRCTRVVTKETLTRELARILSDGIAA